MGGGTGVYPRLTPSRGLSPHAGSHEPQVNSIHPRGTSKAALAALSSFLRSEPDNVPAAKTRDVTEFLAALGLTAKLKPLPIRVTYQDSCHLLHGQKIREAPRVLLHAIPNLDFVELPYSEICCGSAGVYNVTQTEASLKLLSKNGDAPPAAVGTAAKRACRLQERRLLEIKTQMPGGGGGASVMPLNFCMCIPCLPGPPCVTV